MKLRITLVAAALALLGERAVPQDDDDKKLKVVTWKFKKVELEADARTFDAEEAAKEIRKSLAAAGPDEVEKTRSAFELCGGFTKVDLLAKTRKGKDAAPLLDRDVSLKMARHRREMIHRALGEALVSLGWQDRFTACALDSGNKKSGVASDVDQTLFLLAKDPAERGQSPERIRALIEAFDARFEALFKRPPSFFGITSMNGADFFPDWRAEQTVDALRLESHRVFKEKRKNLGAYRTEGQVKSQAEGRGYDELQKQIRKLDLFHQARTLADLLRHPEFEDFRGAKSLEEAKARLEFESPYTEIRCEDGRVVVSALESPAGKILPTKPEFAKRFAFDGSWDNAIQAMHHPDDLPKYLSRSVSEGAGPLYYTGLNVRPAPFEYEKYFAENAGHIELKNFVNSVYKHLDEATRKRYRAAMDVAAMIRLRHKDDRRFRHHTDRQIYQAYLRELSPAEKKLYEGAPQTIEKIRLERARLAWRADAREIVFENLLMTADQPAHILDGQIDRRALARLRLDPAKLEAATVLQFYHFFIDALGLEHARAIAKGDFESRSHPPDMADRILGKFRGKGGSRRRSARSRARPPRCASSSTPRATRTARSTRR